MLAAWRPDMLGPEELDAGEWMAKVDDEWQTEWTRMSLLPIPPSQQGRVTFPPVGSSTH